MKLIIPEEYKPNMSVRETERAIKSVKDFFQNSLYYNLNLYRVSAPLFVYPETGINDDLNGIEAPVKFLVKDVNKEVEVVHSLAKWKRLALYKYGFTKGEGIYTDMNAIRRDEELSNIHSIYVDQWDWEVIIDKNDRNVEMLKSTVEKIYDSLKKLERFVHDEYSFIEKVLPDEITFITTQELEDMYPNLTPKERENEICKLHKAVFLMQVGGALKSGEKHDGRAPDYDDWSLNGDILLWYEPLGIALEISSMGIRVDEEALARQLKIAGCEDRKEFEFHKMVLNKELPYTMGGGIGQSRLCLFFLKKAHIGEVQSSIWSEEDIKRCKEANIILL